MKASRLILAAAMFAALPAIPAFAAEFRSLTAAAVLYDAPSERGRKVFVAPRGMPVEVVLTYGDWTKVRDAGGDLSWVESKLLLPKRSVVVKAANVRVFAAAEDSAAVVFVAERGLLLDYEGASPGWVRVKHRDGMAGYVRPADVWGD